MAERVGADADRRHRHRPGLGRRAGRARPAPATACSALETELGRLGLRAGQRTDRDRRHRHRPDRRGRSGACTRIEFLHCPFRELAEAYPELVCNLHRGLCEGVVDAVGGGRVEEFATLYDPEPCHVTVGVG